NFVNRDDVWIVECRGGTCFSFETVYLCGILRELRWQDLDRDAAVEFQVIREINLTHASGSDLRDDLIMSELLSCSQRWAGFGIDTKTLARRFFQKAVRGVKCDE